MNSGFTANARAMPTRCCCIQSHLVQQVIDHVPALIFAGTNLMDIQGFAHDLPDSHPRVQAGGGILEDDLHLPAVRLHFEADLFLLIEDRCAVIDDLAVGRLDQADHRPPQRTFAASAFAHDPQRFSPENGEGYGLDSLHILFGLERVSFYLEVFFQFFYLDQYRFLLIHDFSASSPGFG